MFLQVCVILFTGGSTWPGNPWTRYTPLDQVHPAGPGTHPPGPGTPPWDQVHPQDQVSPRTRYTPQGPGTPPDQVPPRTRYTPGPGTLPRDQGDMVYAWAVRILLECILVTHFLGFYSCSLPMWCKDQCFSLYNSLTMSLISTGTQVFPMLGCIPQYMDHLLIFLLSTCRYFP